MVGLDGRRGTLEGDTLDDIGVQSTLEEPLDLGTLVLGLGLDLLSLLLEDVNEGVADELALLLGLGDALETIQEALGGVNDSQVDTKVLVQGLLDDVALVQTHAAVVDEHGVEAVADGLLHELGSTALISHHPIIESMAINLHSGVDTTADSTQNMVSLADQLANAGNLLVDEAGHGPVLLSTANVDGKVLQDGSTERGVGDLGVELHTVEGLGLVGNTGIGGVGGGGDGVEVGGELDELVTVTHPDLYLALEAGEQLVDVALVVEALGVEVGVTILTLGTGVNVVLAQTVGDFLQTVADTEDGDTEVEDGGVSVGGCSWIE